MFKILKRIQLELWLFGLARQTHPLLRKLAKEAPGTYHHSLMVGNLAESALAEIGGNSLLGRVGAYYHDIGKMNRPSFFIENQTAYANPHNTLASKMSAMIICSHVKDGLTLASKYHLPTEVKDIIAQHHGTSLITYFYKQAQEENKKKNEPPPSESDFCYPGPKPVSREATVIMLADACEAAVRALEKPSLTKITTLVNKLFKEKIENGQLEDCSCTLRELTIVRDSFIAILNGIFHSRIRYRQNAKLENDS